MRLQPLIQATVDNLCLRLEEHATLHQTACMTYGYANLTGDIISEYCFSEGYHLLSKGDGFERQYQDGWMALALNSHFLKNFNWLSPILLNIPRRIVKALSINSWYLFEQQDKLLEQTEDVIRRREDFKSNAAISDRSLMQAFIESDLPEQDKTAPRLMREALLATAAGTHTTAQTLKIATFYVLEDRELFNDFMAQLEELIPDPASSTSLKDLENVPLLVAIMYESLRTFSGSMHRLARIFPNRPLNYRQWVIPPGTPVSMAPYDVHYDSDIFPEPKAFKPGRWLPLATNGQRLQKYLVAFGRGSRSCVGQELAKAEFLMTFATVFRRMGRRMRIVDTVRERDIEIVRDYMTPMPSAESNGLIVMIDEKN